LVLTVFFVAQLVHYREQEDYLVSLVQQEERVILDLIQRFLVLVRFIVNLTILFDLFAL
jgi:hypothetical protein